jgi:uncharacterized protein YjiK
MRRSLMAPVLGLALLVLAAAGWQPVSAAAPQAPAMRLRQKQMIRTDRLDVRRPAGIAYAGDSDLFLVFPAPAAATDPSAGQGVLLNRFHEGFGTIALPVPLAGGRAVAYDRRGQRLLELDVLAHTIYAIPGTASGEFDVARATALAAPRAAALRPVGMTVDPATGEVFVLDRLMRRILRFTPAEGATVPSHRWVDLGALATRDLTGLAFDPASGHLFTLDVAGKRVLELTPDGAQAASYDVSSVAFSDPQNLVFAPSGDQTDDPATLSLFVADPGLPATRRGNVIELAWTEATSPAFAENTTQATAAATLVRVTATSAYSPPSPDPSGISYDPVRGRLIISDGEVDEMGIYAGKNMFEASLNGTLLRSWTTVSWDLEPCGNAYNPNNHHQIISNDDADRVTDINPGPDGLPGTADDTRTSWKTNGFGCGDAEGIAYDPVANRYFIADGVGEEIWIVKPGNNGVFEGGGDDVVTHFDTHSLGVVDPETVEWKASTGTLLIVSSTGTKVVKEVTTTGTVLASTDLSFANIHKLAGMAYAPSSGGSGMSLYIVDRGSDNNSDPRENDGKMFEISLGGTVSNAAPSVNAGPDRTVTMPGQASLDGTVSDDNLPSPPSLTTTWTKQSGPGTVTFGNANAVDTQASFSAAGTYVLQLTASDGALSASDVMQVTVQSGSGNTAPTVNAGLDQTITLPASAALDGTVADDGLPNPPAALTITWSKVSGPGTVTFGNANAVDTQASFSAAGTYVLQLAASDGSLTTRDSVQITAQGAANTAPQVNAGLDQTITLPANAALDGTVTDDGKPTPPVLTTTWSKVSGPGTVTFGNANAIDTQASFSAAGTYVLQLAASDGQLSASDPVQITVQAAGTPSAFRIASGLDDVEENASGSVYNNSTDLELVFDTSNQTVGLRFVNVAIPKNATITGASIQFQADEAQSDSTVLTIHGQASGNAPAFGTAKFDVSGRARTAASVTWTPAPWTTVGQAGANQRTQDIKNILQEIVNRSDWVSGNSIVILVSGIGHRTAESFEGLPAAAPLLQVQFQ